MSLQHLSNDQLTAWLAGERPRDLASHLEQCVECQGEVARFESLLAGFHAGVRVVAQVDRVPVFEPPTSRWKAVPQRWVLAGALAALVAAIPLYRGKTSVPAQQIVAEVSDSALFEQVNAQLARRVPGAMEPLEALAWPAADEQLKESQPKGQNE